MAMNYNNPGNQPIYRVDGTTPGGVVDMNTVYQTQVPTMMPPPPQLQSQPQYQYPHSFFGQPNTQQQQQQQQLQQQHQSQKIMTHQPQAAHAVASMVSKPQRPPPLSDEQRVTKLFEECRPRKRSAQAISSSSASASAAAPKEEDSYMVDEKASKMLIRYTETLCETLLEQAIQISKNRGSKRIDEKDVTLLLGKGATNFR